MAGIKETVMEVGGKQYPLLLSYNAICEFDATIGSATLLLRGTADAKNFLAYRGLVWTANNEHARVHEQPEKRISIEQAGDLCQQYVADNGIQKFIDLMKRLQNDCGWLGEKSGGEEKNGIPSQEA